MIKIEKGRASADDINAAKAKYHAVSDEYSKFSKAMGLPQQRERINISPHGGVDVSFGNSAKTAEKAVEKSAKSDIIKSGKDISKYIGQPISSFDNQSIREWYVSNVENIPNLIDESLSTEEQARQAFELRNKFKREARIAMSDVETADMLEKKHPIPSFEELVKSKMKRKGITREEAVIDILKTASTTNPNINKEFDL